MKAIKRLETDLSKAKDMLENGGAKGAAREKLEFDIEELKHRLGWAYMDAGDFDAGLDMYRGLSEKTHGEKKHCGIGRAYVELGRLDVALRYLKLGIDQYPGSYPLLNAIGFIYFRTEDYYESLKYIEMALKAASKDDEADTLYRKALILNHLAYFEESFKILTELIKKKPDDPAIVIETAFTELNRGRATEAVRHYTRAKKLGFEGPGVYGGLYQAYSNLRMEDKAIKAIKEGIGKFNDAHPWLYYYLVDGYLRFGLNRKKPLYVKKAVKAAEEGLKKFPDDKELKGRLDALKRSEGLAEE